MHHAYCVIALLKEWSEASMLLQIPYHILFLLRYIHESFLRFWLNANNSECFFYPQCFVKPQREHVCWSMTVAHAEIRLKVTNIIRKEKTLGDTSLIKVRFHHFSFVCSTKSCMFMAKLRGGTRTGSADPLNFSLPYYGSYRLQIVAV